MAINPMLKAPRHPPRSPPSVTRSIVRGPKHMDIIHLRKEQYMNIAEKLKQEEGKIGYILAWALGIPVPILLIIFLMRGCN
jgi:hypothetical protein